MKNLKLLLIFLGLIFISQKTFSQSSFYVDSVTTCYFNKPYIYFTNGQMLTKSDYYGNILWKKQIDYIHPQFFGGFEFSDDALYGWSTDSLLFKLDTAGNLIWAKSFGNFLDPSANNQQSITMVTVVDDGLIVGVTQLDAAFYNAINAHFKLDTAGNITNQLCYQPFFSTFNITMQKGKKSIQGNGVWIGSQNRIAATREPLIQKFGNNGQSMSIAVPGMGGSQLIGFREIKILTDSTYLASIIKYNSNGTQYLELIRFNESGQTLWIKFLEYPFGNYSGAEVLGITCDSAGFIYLFAVFQDLAFSPYMRPIIFKLDLAGNIVWNKAWNTQDLFSIFSITQNLFGKGSEIDFYNDSLRIFCFDNAAGGIIAFDTSMSGTCFSPDTFLTVNISQMTPIGFPFNYTSFNYTIGTLPYLQSITQPLPSVTNSCLNTYTRESEIESDINIFPNPVSEEFTISGCCPESVVNVINIYDILGNHVLQKIPVQKNGEVNVSMKFFPQGFYIVEVVSGSKIKREIILKW